SPDAHVGEHSGTRPVTGTGKGFYCTTTAHRKRSAPSYATWTSFSKPFSGSAGKAWVNVFASVATAGMWGSHAGESLCGSPRPAARGPSGAAAAGSLTCHPLRLT